jgi:hypothetical protein
VRIDPDQPKERVNIADQDDTSPGEEYTPPALIALGSFEELTQGFGVPVCN